MRLFWASLRRVCQRSINIVTFEVWVIIQYLRDRYATHQPFKNRLNRVMKATSTRFAMANIRISGDATHGDSRYLMIISTLGDVVIGLG